MSKYRWQDIVALILGVYIVAAPWLITMQLTSADITRVVFAAHFIIGSAVTGLAASAMRTSRSWPEWLQALLGLCITTSPLALGSSDMVVLGYNSVFVGLILMVLAGSALSTRRRPPSSSW